MAGNRKIAPLVLRGAKEICEAVGVPKRHLNSYVETHGLPAFKVGGREWLAIPAELEKWIMEQSVRCRK